MAEGVSTRLQKEVTQHQKELERIEIKIDDSVNHLRHEMQQMRSDVKHMFDQIMLKLEGRNTSKVVVELPEEIDKSKEGSSASESKSTRSKAHENFLNLVGEGLMRNCKYGRLECPCFADFSSWLLKAEQYFEYERVEDASRVRTVMMHLDGRALQWHQHYSKINGGLNAL